MTYVQISDAFRIVAGALSLWLICALSVMAWRRFRDEGARSPANPIGVMGFVVMMVFGILRRIVNRGTPGDVFLWGYLLSMVIILIGFVVTNNVYVLPPWLRRRASRFRR